MKSLVPLYLSPPSVLWRCIYIEVYFRHRFRNDSGFFFDCDNRCYNRRLSTFFWMQGYAPNFMSRRGSIILDPYSCSRSFFFFRESSFIGNYQYSKRYTEPVGYTRYPRPGLILLGMHEGWMPGPCGSDVPMPLLIWHCPTHHKKRTHFFQCGASCRS